MIEKTLGQVLDETAKKYPKNDALVYLDGPRYTYKEFKEIVDKVARGLVALGVKNQDHVAVWATNVPEWVILQFATAKIGAVLVTVNIYYKARELEYLLRQSDSKYLFLIDKFKDVSYVDTLYTIMPEIRKGEKSSNFPLFEKAIFMGKESYDGLLNFEDILSMSKEVSEEELKQREKIVNPHDVVNMQYTSGTTGFPKGVMLTHYNIVNNAYWVGKNLDLSNKDRLCIPVPFFHCFGCVISTLNCVVHGATMVPIEFFDAEKVLKSVDKEKCTALQGVPTMFVRELNHPDFEKYDTSSLRTGIMAGAPCPSELMKRVMEEMHAKEITICYGLTETSPVLTQTKRDDPFDKRVGSVGKPLPHVELKVVEPDTDKELPPNTPGELIARGYGVMKGYYKMPEATAKTIRNGWLHTKDLAMIDNEGYVYILGRVDDMIIRGGENVYPREIEEFLYKHEKIKEVAVVGVPHSEYGEEVAAFIQLKDGMSASEEEIKEFCRKNIARYKVPKYILFINEWPMTASGKIQKFRLKEIAKEKLGLK